MAVPKRAQLAKRQKDKLSENNLGNQSERSIYLGLKYDFEHNSLPEWKKEKYFKLRDIYEK